MLLESDFCKASEISALAGNKLIGRLPVLWHRGMGTGIRIIEGIWYRNWAAPQDVHQALAVWSLSNSCAFPVPLKRKWYFEPEL